MLLTYSITKAKRMLCDVEPLNKKTSVVPVSQCYVIKQMVNAIACTIELWMHLGGLLSTQEARVALGYRLVRLLRFFRA